MSIDKIIYIVLFVIGLIVVNALKDYTESRSSAILSFVTALLYFGLSFLSGEVDIVPLVIGGLIYFVIIYISSFIGFKVANTMGSDSKIGYYLWFLFFAGIPLGIFSFALSMFLGKM